MVPQHVAIIMDGNGRWAKQRFHPRSFGHVRGASRVRGVVEAASQAGVKVLTLYAFSTENWSRPEAERTVLWSLLKKFLLKERDELNRQGVRLMTIGDTNALGPEVLAVLDESKALLSKNSGLTLNLALNYGGRDEVLRATRKALEQGEAELTEQKIWDHLDTAELGKLASVDLLIRTSGEQRTSNFLIWQAAYAEFYFTDLCWPDFTQQEFEKALEAFANRDRRFGAISSTSDKTKGGELHV